MNVTRKELALIFDVSEKMIRNYEAMGLKVQNAGKRGVAVSYDLKEAVEWLRTYTREQTLRELTQGGNSKVNDENANIELLKNRAQKEFYNIAISKENSEIQRIKKEKLMNNLIESGHVKDVLTTVFIAIKNQIETFPQSMSTSLVGKSESDIKAILNKNVNRLLEQLCETDAFDKILALNADMDEDNIDNVEQEEDDK